MPIPNEELQARYVGIRKNVVPAAKTYTENTDPKNSARQASALKRFILEEPELAGLRAVTGDDVPAVFALSYGIDIGTVLGAKIAKDQLEDSIICPECKVAVVDLIEAARKFIALTEAPEGVGDLSKGVAIYKAFKAALAQLDTTHDDSDIVGGA